MCDVALVLGDSSGIGLLAQTRLNLPNAHSERLFGLIEVTLRQAGREPSALTGVAVSLGPGSFTGLRIGLSAAKGLCHGLGIPLAGVPTLDALAQRVRVMQGRLSIAMPARRGEWYFAQYAGGRRTGAVEVRTTSEVIRAVERGDTLVTPQPDIFRELEQQAVTVLAREYAAPDAWYVAEIGCAMLDRNEAADLEQVVPLYVQKFKGVG